MKIQINYPIKNSEEENVLMKNISKFYVTLIKENIERLDVSVEIKKRILKEILSEFK